jgi:SAM-dependent MidA family methyltransferase
MTDLATILRRNVRRERVISFARFMETALYCPEIGYYERSGRPVGREGDFYTSVSVGSLFGELLSFQFADWLEALCQPSVALVEAGAHDGQLASDILSWLRDARPDLFPRVEYCVVEPSQRRQAWQRRKLEKFAGQVRWHHGFDDLRPAGVDGIIFSNELLDAFPVHILRWDALEGRWREWGVTLKGGEFAWERMSLDAGPCRDHIRFAGLAVPLALAQHLPDGFTVELSPQAFAWWGNAASRLRSGRLITFDYGGTAEELLSPHRSRGTLRGFANHVATDDVLATPGYQDLTAHVNFTQLRAAGELAGLKSDPLLAQSVFLTRIVKRTMAPNAAFGSWTPANTRQLQTLTHPEHLGHSFRVFIQSRDV